MERPREARTPVERDRDSEYVMVSIGRLPEKERRKARRRNHIARDLSKSRFRQRIITTKTKEEKYDEEDEE